MSTKFEVNNVTISTLLGYVESCIPSGFEKMTEPDYENFLKLRRIQMAKKVHQFFESL